MYYLYIVTGLAVLASFIVNREKTLKAVKIAAKRFINILPAFLTMIILVSIVLFLIPDEVISSYLGGTNKFIGVLFASFFGSITLMPGFIAFPLCGVLLKKGVLFMVLSAFTTTLMMVGVLTYPVEKEYFGIKVTVIRNTISFFIALIVAVMIGIFFGEIF
ncbi:permease [Chloroflexota bacterium]